MNRRVVLTFLLGGLVALAGCGTYRRTGLSPAQARLLKESLRQRMRALDGAREARVLALDARHVSEQDVREVLHDLPAPRLINIHGGMYTVVPRMIGFCEFLMGMGYPGGSITNPGDGTFTFSCYEGSRKIAGCLAWYYEQEGLRPVMVGHSQGGFQVVKVLDLLAGGDGVRVWNPLSWEQEDRDTILDPLTGAPLPVTCLKVPYVTSLGAGGLTRVLPNQWDMLWRLRDIPDSVEEFTGFYQGMDLLGGDFLGYGSANHFQARGTAKVRNVRLPSAWVHGKIVETKHLLHRQETKDRINAYQPPAEDTFEVPANADTLNPETLHLAWAADVWYSLKKHWVLELQRLIRARQAQRHVL